MVVSYELSTQRTKVRNTRLGSELYMEGKEAAAFIKEMQDDLQRPWHKKNNSKDWEGIYCCYLDFGWPGIALFSDRTLACRKMASTVSVKTERQLGDAVYDAMGLSAAEDTAASFLLNEFFATMEVPSAYSVRITVVNDNVVNAFAVPGGRIVVYSALLKQIQSYPELAALLSHEFTHVNKKHSTKSIFRRLGSKVFIGLLFGSFGSVTSVLIDHADDLKSLTYSRKLEKEADIKGLEILLQRKIDPKGFEDLFHHLKEAFPMLKKGSVILKNRQKMQP
ncbi:MAG: M48 family metallopeptidase [Chitinophagaceae bacterium]|nr:M48 family metallopeptidase [Chitinophagaceae bacterium]